MFDFALHIASVKIFTSLLSLVESKISLFNVLYVYVPGQKPQFRGVSAVRRLLFK